MNIKNWKVEYDHKDGRKGTLDVTTEIEKSGAFDYGNGLCGRIIVNGCDRNYDLRYCTSDDLHRVMLKEYFGRGLVSATEKGE